MELYCLCRQMADHWVGLSIMSRVIGYWGSSGEKDQVSTCSARPWLMLSQALRSASSPIWI